MPVPMLRTPPHVISVIPSDVGFALPPGHRGEGRAGTHASPDGPLLRRERARAEGGHRAADEAKRTAAHDLGLHVVNHDHVLYPDAQLDIEDADGRSGRVNVEIVSDHYHAAAIAAKAGAGYAMHGSNRSATRKIARALARETDAGRGGGPSQPGRDGSVEL